MHVASYEKSVLAAKKTLEKKYVFFWIFIIVCVIAMFFSEMNIGISIILGIVAGVAFFRLYFLFEKHHTVSYIKNLSALAREVDVEIQICEKQLQLAESLVKRAKKAPEILSGISESNTETLIRLIHECARQFEEERENISYSSLYSGEKFLSRKEKQKGNRPVRYVFCFVDKSPFVFKTDYIPDLDSSNYKHRLEISLDIIKGSAEMKKTVREVIGDCMKSLPSHQEELAGHIFKIIKGEQERLKYVRDKIEKQMKDRRESIK